MRRLGQSSFVPLLLLDLVAVATFARCFTGPSELWLIVPVCAGAHLVAHGARLLSARGWKLASLGVWILTVVLVAWVPVLALDLTKVSWGFPAGHGATVLAHQLSRAWHLFSVDVAPVSPQTGLVLAAAWASGAVAIAAEALDADRSLPALVAFVPAFDIVLFTGTLGTSTGRPLELAALGALGVWYLSASVGRSRREHIVVARLDARSRLNGTKPAQTRVTRIAAPGLVVVAAVAAGIIGPLIPGANSPALVAWHGRAGSGRSGQGLNNGAVGVSTLVQVGEEEVDNPDTVLATVHSSLLSREVLIALDDFNGNQWTPGRRVEGGVPALGAVHGSLGHLLADPPPESFSGGTGELTQVIRLGRYGGPYLPTPGNPVAISGVRVFPEGSSSGPLVPVDGFFRGETYAVTATVNPPPPQGYVGNPSSESGIVPPGGLPLAVDQILPGPVPARIVQLAHSIVAGAVTQLQEADDIVQYFTQGGRFRYALPKRLKSGALTDTGEGYTALVQFLFHSRVGYCQQYASAFAVLARVIGLPTRVVVGFLPGQATGANSWEITGQDVHAWPQVYFPGVGWSDFEPTPSTPVPFEFPTTPGGTVPVTGTTIPGTTPVTGTTRPSNLLTHTPDKPHKGGAKPVRPAARPHHRTVRGGGGVSPGDLLLGLLALAGLWAVVVPLSRLLLSRRRRLHPRRGVVTSWRDVLHVLAAAGYHRRRTETYSEFAQRVRLAGVLPSPADDALRRLAIEVNKACFGRGPLPRADIAQAASDARAIRRAAWKRVSWRQRVVAELDPRDLVRVA